MLALALMSEATGDDYWLDIAHQHTAKLAARGHGIGSLTHWMVYALEAMVRVRREPWLIDYAARLAAWMLTDEATRQSREATPLACQTEGLLAYARMLVALGEDGDPSLDAVLKQVGRNLRRQMRFFHTDGGFFRSLDIREVENRLHHPPRDRVSRLRPSHAGTCACRPLDRAAGKKRGPAEFFSGSRRPRLVV